MRPTEAEFGVTIEFVRGESDPVNVFRAMTELLSAFQGMDGVLVGATAPDVQFHTVIEDIETASITAWLRNILTKADDDAIKSMDWKKQVGSYLVRGKYRILKYLEQRQQKEDVHRLEVLRSDLELLGMDLPQRSLIPPTIDLEALVPEMNKVQGAKALLTRGETLKVRSDVAGEVELDVTRTEAVPVPPEMFRSDLQMLDSADDPVRRDLLIRKADLLGKSQWEFRDGKRAVKANIEDAQWLGRFHRGEVKLVPGSVMRATVQANDSGGEVIIQVHDIVPPAQDVQESLFGEWD